MLNITDSKWNRIFRSLGNWFGFRYDETSKKRPAAVPEKGGLDRGIIATPESSIGVAAVYGCCRVYSDILASARPELIERDKKGKIISTIPLSSLSNRRLLKYPILSTLKNSPNPWFDSFADFLGTASFHQVSTGVFYAEKIRDTDGTLIGLFPRSTYRIEIKQENGSVGYEYSAGDEKSPKRTILKDDMFSVTLPGTDPLAPVSPLSKAIDYISIALNARRTFLSTAASGGKGPLAIKSATLLDDTDFQVLSNRLGKQLQDVSSGERDLILLELGLDIGKIAFTAQELQFLETVKANDANICAIFRVPPVLVWNETTSFSANVPVIVANWVNFSLNPFVERWNRAINTLLKEEDVPYEFALNVEFASTPPSTEQQSILTSYVKNGIITVNEARDNLRLPPADGGDILRTQAQNVPLTATTNKKGKLETPETPDTPKTPEI